MKILVTGAAGRLGSLLCADLLEAGHEVLGVDRVPAPDRSLPIDFHDLRDEFACLRLAKGMDAVVHLGNHTRSEFETFPIVYGENCVTNANVFNAAEAGGARCVVFASSIQAISGSRRIMDDGKKSCLPYLPLDSDVPPCPGNSYGLSKVAGEELLKHYVEEVGLKAGFAIRFPALIRSMKKLTEYLDGRTLHRRERPFHNPDEAFLMLWLKDASDLIRMCIESGVEGYHCYLAAADEPYLYKLSAEEIAREYLPEVPWKIPASESKGLCDTSRITREIGWRPTPMAEAVAQTLPAHPNMRGW